MIQVLTKTLWKRRSTSFLHNMFLSWLSMMKKLSYVEPGLVFLGIIKQTCFKSIVDFHQYEVHGDTKKPPVKRKTWKGHVSRLWNDTGTTGLHKKKSITSMWFFFFKICSIWDTVAMWLKYSAPRHGTTVYRGPCLFASNAYRWRQQAPRCRS